MRPLACLLTIAAMGSAVGACASETYYSRSGYGYGPSYAYSTPTYYSTSTPAYYSTPSYYRTTTYGYSQPQPQVYYSPRRGYDGYWDYQRNYRGIHASPEFSSM